MLRNQTVLNRPCHLRMVVADVPTEAAYHAPDAMLASEHIREIPADLRSRLRWVAATTTFDVVRHPRSPKEEGKGRSPNTAPVPSSGRPASPQPHGGQGSPIFFDETPAYSLGTSPFGMDATFPHRVLIFPRDGCGRHAARQSGNPDNAELYCCVPSAQLEGHSDCCDRVHSKHTLLGGPSGPPPGDDTYSHGLALPSVRDATLVFARPGARNAA